MTVSVVQGYNDQGFEGVRELFYENFPPDDWDYIITGTDEHEVRSLASRLEVCDSCVQLIAGQWVAVTYHS